MRWRTLPSLVLLAVIRLYRATWSYVVGPCCRYEPSCSAYAEEAVRRHGALRGTGLALWRVLRCHPFARGGVDPVPESGNHAHAHRPFHACLPRASGSSRS